VGELLAQQLFFLRLVVVGHADQGLVAGGAQRLLRGIEQIHEQGVRQLRDQDRHMVAVLRRERAGGRVGHVVQPGGRRLHRFDQLRADRALAAQGARDGDRAHAGRRGHIVERDAPGRAAAFAGKAVHARRVSAEEGAKCCP
jgi:hypothetical protein